MKSTLFYLIRHGETEWNAAKRLQGHEDIPLNANGMEQARLLAEELKEISFDAFYASPLSRAFQTASLLKRNSKITTDHRLKEARYGVFEGMTQHEYYEKAGDLLRQREALLFLDKMNFRIHPTAESFYEVYLRAQACLDELAIKHQGECIAIVTHGGFIRSVLSMIERIDPGQIIIHNTGYVVLNVEKTQYRPIQYCRIER